MAVRYKENEMDEWRSDYIVCEIDKIIQCLKKVRICILNIDQVTKTKDS